MMYGNNDLLSNNGKECNINLFGEARGKQSSNWLRRSSRHEPSCSAIGRSLDFFNVIIISVWIDILVVEKK